MAVGNSADLKRGDHSAREPRSAFSLTLIGFLVLLGFLGFASLGVWQIERRAWKLDLIARTEARVHAPPVAAPGPAGWPAINVRDDEYRRVTISGHFLHDGETLVTAVTDAGAGYWVLTPLKTGSGFTALINRGFVPSERKERETRSAGEIGGEVTITGLLRMTEPKGAFLRTNDVSADRWFSRDVTVTGLMRMTEPKGAFLRANDISADRWFSRDVDAIAIKRGLDNYAPYFIDADATPNPGGFPIGGLTVIDFPNNHLVYALTWFVLALMVAVAGVRLALEEINLRREAKRAGAAAKV